MTTKDRNLYLFYRKVVSDMRKRGSDHWGTRGLQGPREILRDPSLVWFVAYAVATGLVILALLT